VNTVFIGSCTNGRLEDLEAAASVLKGRKVASGVHLLIVPGSQTTNATPKRPIRRVFRAAGADWRESGCSMCLGMNGDTVGAGQYSLSTSNRNFEGARVWALALCSRARSPPPASARARPHHRPSEFL